MTRTTLSAVDSLSLSLDSESTLRVSLRGATFSYPSSLPATLCNCALSLGAATLPLTLSGGSCAPLSKEASRLDVGATAAPDGVLAAALLSARGGASVACTASVLGGAFSRRIEVPLGGRAGGAPAGQGGAPSGAPAGQGAAPSAGAPAGQGAASSGAPAAPPPPSLAPALSGFESASSMLVFDAAQFRASLPFPLGALHVTAPGATLAVEEGATVVASATLLPVSIHDDGAAPAAPGSAQALLVFASSPARALSSVAPGLTLSAVAAATGLPAEALVALLGVAGVRVPAAMAGAAAAAPASGGPTFTLRGRALPLGADGAAVAAAVAGLIGGAAAAPAAGCALDAAPLPWLRAALSGPSAPPCIDDTLLVARVATMSSAGAAAAAATSIMLSAPGTGIDFSVPCTDAGCCGDFAPLSASDRPPYSPTGPVFNLHLSAVTFTAFPLPIVLLWALAIAFWVAAPGCSLALGRSIPLRGVASGRCSLYVPLCIFLAAIARGALALHPRLDPHLPDDPLELWRLPGLSRVHPARANLTALSKRLTIRGFAADGTDAAALSAHVPFEETLSHTAIHEGVGYVSINYTARLARTTVHLDEFIPLFRDLNATWECENSTGSVHYSVHSTLAFAAPPPNSTVLAAEVHALRYLAARLRAPNSTLTWGPALLGLHENVTLWAPSCLALLNSSLYKAPYFSVAAASLSISSHRLAFFLTPSSPLPLFSYVKAGAWRFDPNITHALDHFPTAPVLSEDGQPLSVQVEGNGTRRVLAGKDAAWTSRRSFRYKTASIDLLNWNYQAPNVARVSPVAIAAGVPSSEMGCHDC